MSVHENHIVTHQLVGIRHGLLGVAGIIEHDLRDRFSQHPAFGVNVLHRLIGTNPQLRPKRRVRSGQWPDHANFHLCDGRQCAAQYESCDQKNKDNPHASAPLRLTSRTSPKPACMPIIGTTAAPARVVRATKRAWPRTRPLPRRPDNLGEIADGRFP